MDYYSKSYWQPRLHICNMQLFMVLIYMPYGLFWFYSVALQGDIPSILNICLSVIYTCVVVDALYDLVSEWNNRLFVAGKPKWGILIFHAGKQAGNGLSLGYKITIYSHGIVIPYHYGAILLGRKLIDSITKEIK